MRKERNVFHAALVAMVTIDPMHRMPQIYLSADPHRYAANTSFSHSFSKNIPRSAFRTSMLRPFQLIYCFFSKIFHMSLLKSTDFLGIVQIDRHGLLLFLFCGDSKIELMSVFFQPRLPPFIVFHLNSCQKPSKNPFFRRFPAKSTTKNGNGATVPGSVRRSGRAVSPARRTKPFARPGWMPAVTIAAKGSMRKCSPPHWKARPLSRRMCTRS